METYDIKRVGLIFAIQAEIDGMKADNAKKTYKDKPILFGWDRFQAKAEELRNIVYCPNEQL